MNVVFADTFYFFALLNPRDEAHALAVEWSDTYEGRLVTGEWILLELADGLASTRHRTTFNRLRLRLATNENYQVLPLDAATFEAGVRLYDERPDKEWSLTDCLSFVAMEGGGIKDALTGDHHFEQAGFRALFT